MSIAKVNYNPISYRVMFPFSVGDRVQFSFGKGKIHGKILVSGYKKSDVQANSGLVYSVNNSEIVKE